MMVTNVQNMNRNRLAGGNGYGVASFGFATAWISSMGRVALVRAFSTRVPSQLGHKPFWEHDTSGRKHWMHNRGVGLHPPQD